LLIIRRILSEILGKRQDLNRSSSLAGAVVEGSKVYYNALLHPSYIPPSDCGVSHQPQRLMANGFQQDEQYEKSTAINGKRLVPCFPSRKHKTCYNYKEH
jgi:hypothetical protein